MRSLSPEEAELWARVTASIRPLSRRPVTKAEPDQPQPPAEQSRPTVRPQPRPPSPARAIPGTTLDGSWDRKLKAGSVQPDRILDLHGLIIYKYLTAI